MILDVVSRGSRVGHDHGAGPNTPGPIHCPLRHTETKYTQGKPKVRTELAVFCLEFEPTHEILAIFVLCKLILQTRMRSHPVGLDL